jgi:AcrR family transcriptional regulator
MQQIAARVGVTAAGLYYYFPSKQSLLFEVLETALERLVDRMRAAVAAVPTDAADRPTRQLRAFITEHLRYQIEELEATAVYAAAFYGSYHLLNALTDEHRTRLAELQRASFDLLRSILQEGNAAGRFDVTEVTATASAIVAMGEFAPSWFRPGGRLTSSDLASLYGDLVVRMVRRG